MMSSSQPPSREKRPLGLDELIAIVVAFGTMGSIFFWVTGKNPNQFSATNWQFPAVFSQPAAVPDSSKTLTSPPSSSDTLKPATTVIPSPSRTTPGSPLPQIVVPIPVILPPVSAVPEQPIVRSIPAPATTKPQPDKEKVGPVKFSDVPDKYWARPFIVALVDRKIFADFTDNKFRPDEPITRAELARLIQRMSAQEPRRKSLNFKDVKSGNSAASSIDYSVKTGYLKGYPDNAFRPDKEIPRVEVIAALASGLNLKPSTKETKTLQVYTDRKKLPKWAVSKVASATEAGIVVNYPKRQLLRPNATATRAEVATMIYQAMAKQGKVPAKSSQYIVRRSKVSD
ncbi:S-layer homology domain-containing protein [Tychonema sp. BBK16]|uniref:S-layer homology domain-containing protein n=1 Tax=Tychonema sp. BBK16 TaxID=2699888 RepID=UPI001F3F60B0|nr:S-layer homology domain-containing protein [Tychonema sp. BBK16]MCF6375487.1 S-layer homology domain-containing protein [Tychonema sp. BBK16]